MSATAKEIDQLDAKVELVHVPQADILQPLVHVHERNMFQLLEHNRLVRLAMGQGRALSREEWLIRARGRQHAKAFAISVAEQPPIEHVPEQEPAWPPHALTDDMEPWPASKLEYRNPLCRRI